MKSHGITKDQIEQSIRNPDEKFPDQIGMVIHKLLINAESQEKYRWRIFYQEDKDKKVIISAYKTTKIKKYWKGDMSEDQL